MTRGVELTRLAALDTCNRKGWKEGDFLMSASWKTPKCIRGFMGKFVKISDEDGSRASRVHSFPSDVERISEKTV